MPTHIDFPLTPNLAKLYKTDSFMRQRYNFYSSYPHKFSADPFIVDNEIRYDVTCLMFVANGDSDFVSAILENFCFEDCQF